jgi:hypothetical protein
VTNALAYFGRTKKFRNTAGRSIRRPFLRRNDIDDSLDAAVATVDELDAGDAGVDAAAASNPVTTS